ncbi:antitoxin [Streptomyces sp. DSM 42041]|uniref:Antitoxin n=1 Tax=Streptomyces hazeniae TaxID=3075538 RepID=A0ABU2P1F2_9ACTN|nr:antitoxin [Streptomyces sp. DSM 42041]MDT0382268.1 antitoxin [Streptomyces sp. DSM 42041]
MSFMDKVKGMLGQHGDKADQGMEKAGNTLDERTGGKHSDKIDTGTQKGQEAMDRWTQEGGKGGDQPGGRGGGSAA